jgi:tRNA-specific 2-thiouridylase
MEEAFRRDVVGDFISEYAAGRTPNPCVRCNTYVKFGPLLEKAARMGFDAIATGHYVRRSPAPENPDRAALHRARDAGKDQSYVLWGLPREALDRCIFPLGTARKPAVKRLARRLGLPVWDRPESQDICFVPSGGHTDFVAEHLSPDHPMRSPGLVRDVSSGAVLGTHSGLLGTTIGQRKGLRIAGSERQYVSRLEPETATLWLGPKEAGEAWGLVAHEGNLLAPVEMLECASVTAKVRYRTPPAPCRVRVDGDVWRVRFEQPVGAVTPGQSVVFYAGDRILGGARILAADLGKSESPATGATGSPASEVLRRSPFEC